MEHMNIVAAEWMAINDIPWNDKNPKAPLFDRFHRGLLLITHTLM